MVFLVVLPFWFGFFVWVGGWLNPSLLAYFGYFIYCSFVGFLNGSLALSGSDRKALPLCLAYRPSELMYQRGSAGRKKTCGDRVVAHSGALACGVSRSCRARGADLPHWSTPLLCAGMGAVLLALGLPLSPPPHTLTEHTPLATPRGDSDGVAPTWPDANDDLAPPAPHTRSQLSMTDQDTLTARKMLGAAAPPAAGDITPGYSPSAVEWHVGTGGAASSCQRRWDQRGPDRSRQALMSSRYRTGIFSLQMRSPSYNPVKYSYLFPDFPDQGRPNPQALNSDQPHNASLPTCSIAF